MIIENEMLWMHQNTSFKEYIYKYILDQLLKQEVWEIKESNLTLLQSNKVRLSFLIMS